jgi:hypothetical protein
VSASRGRLFRSLAHHGIRAFRRVTLVGDGPDGQGGGEAAAGDLPGPARPATRGAGGPRATAAAVGE